MKKLPKIIFTDGDDSRISQVIEKAHLAKKFIPVVITNKTYSHCECYPLVENKAIVDLVKQAYIKKGYSDNEIRKLSLDPIIYGLALVKLGKADGIIGGATVTTKEFLVKCFKILGINKNKWKKASSSMILSKNGSHYFFSDVSIHLSPSVEEAVEIAEQTYDIANKIMNKKTNLAVLSYSTNGSGQGELVQKSQDIVNELKKTNLVDHLLEAESQFDAAFLPAIRKSKFPSSKLQGDINIFIFPDLNAANIGYKIAERMGDYVAAGPIISGLNFPASDLSRGSTPEGIFQTALYIAKIVEGK